VSALHGRSSTGKSYGPPRSFWQIWNMSFGFLGIQFGWGLQMANISAICEKLLVVYNNASKTVELNIPVENTPLETAHQFQRVFGDTTAEVVAGRLLSLIAVANARCIQRALAAQSSSAGLGSFAFDARLILGKFSSARLRFMFRRCFCAVFRSGRLCRAIGAP
jgi:hypothetical protein